MRAPHLLALVLAFSTLLALDVSRAAAGSKASCEVGYYESNEIEFQSHAELLAEEEARAVEAMRAPERGRIADGGLIIVTVYRSTIGSANSKYAELLIVKDGKVHLRKQGKDQIPHVPFDGRHWWSLFTTWMPVDIEAPFELRVFDELIGESCSIMVGPDMRLRNATDHARYLDRRAQEEKKAERKAAKRARREAKRGLPTAK